MFYIIPIIVLQYGVMPAPLRFGGRLRQYRGVCAAKVPASGWAGPAWCGRCGRLRCPAASRDRPGCPAPAWALRRPGLLISRCPRSPHSCKTKRRPPRSRPCAALPGREARKPQVFPVHRHGGFDVMRHKVRVGVAEPQKLRLRHFASQRNKIQYPFALHIMPYADDHGLSAARRYFSRRMDRLAGLGAKNRVSTPLESGTMGGRKR